jgi:hypothetical protein
VSIKWQRTRFLICLALGLVLTRLVLSPFLERGSLAGAVLAALLLLVFGLPVAVWSDKRRWRRAFDGR